MSLPRDVPTLRGIVGPLLSLFALPPNRHPMTHAPHHGERMERVTTTNYSTNSADLDYFLLGVLKSYLLYSLST